MCQTIGRVLARLREKQNETQDQVADAIGISRVAYTRYESDQREPKVSTALRLAQHFGVSVEFLMGESSESEELRAQNSLNAQERAVIEAYRNLNDDGREWIKTALDMALKTQSSRKGESNTETA